MDEEISQEGSLKEKSSLTKSTGPSQISRGVEYGEISTILEELEYEEEESFDEEHTVYLATGTEDSEKNLEDDDNEFLKNPGILQAYNLGTVIPPKYEEEEDVYLRLVKEAKIMPIKRIVNSFKKSALHLEYYGLDCAQLKPLSEALVDNESVKELNLKSNNLSLDAMYHLGLMLSRNAFIRVLNLSQCKITAEGIEMLGRGLEICPRLAFLDLSYNEFGDQGMAILGDKLNYNTSITNLNVSHNNLTHKTGFHLVEAMEENYTLHHLDLSWNQMSEDQGLKKFLNSAAEHNESLLSLDLSWNTLSGEKTANTIKNFITQHRSLQTLNLSHNRLETAAEVTKIAKGINAAQSLKEINLSYNGITADTAFVLLSNVNAKTKINTLRLDNVWVKPEFEKMRRDLENQTGMKVIIEGVSGGVDVKAPDMQTLLLKRAHYLGNLPKKPKNKKDFGWFLLRLQKTGKLEPVKKAKFEKLVMEDKIKFDEGMVEELSKRFKDENKKIDLNLMLEKYMVLYPDTALPIVKEKKKNTSKDRKGSPKKVNEAESPLKVDDAEIIEKVDEAEIPEKVDEAESRKSIDAEESPKKLDEAESPEKRDEESAEKLEEVEEGRTETGESQLVRKSSVFKEAITGEGSIKNEPSQENKRKESEVTAGVQEKMKQENNVQQTEVSSKKQSSDLMETLEDNKENATEERKTEDIEETAEVNVVNETKKEENDTHVPPKKWTINSR